MSGADFHQELVKQLKDPTLVATLLEELRTRRIVCPPLAVIERPAGSVRARAQRQLWRRLADGLTDQQLQSLDQLLEVRAWGRPKHNGVVATDRF